MTLFKNLDHSPWKPTITKSILFCHLTRRCFAKPDPEMGVCYILRSCPITEVLVRESPKRVRRQ